MAKDKGIKDIEVETPTMEEEVPEMGSDKSFLDILDEVEREGYQSISKVAEEVETEIAENLGDNDDEGTGLKEDKAKPGKEKKTETEEIENKDELEEIEKENDEKQADPEDAEHTDEWLQNTLKEIDESIDLSSKESVEEVVSKATTAMKDAERLQTELNNEQEANKEFYELLQGSEVLQEVARYMFQNKATMENALMVLNITPDVNLEELKKNDPDAYIDLMNNRKKAEEAKQAQQRSKQKEKDILEKNRNTNQRSVEAFKNDHSMDSNSFDKFADQVNPFIEELGAGLTSKNFMNLLYKGLNYDTDIKKANEEGVIKGRNEKIKTEKRKRVGDGLPELTSSSNAPTQAENEKRSMFDSALDGEPSRITDIYKD